MAFLALIQHFLIYCITIALLFLPHVGFHFFTALKLLAVVCLRRLEELAFGGFILLEGFGLYVCTIHEHNLVNTTYYIPLSIIPLFQHVIRRHYTNESASIALCACL